MKAKLFFLTAALVSLNACGIYSLGDGNGCFRAGTPINSPNGSIAIEKLTPGTPVYSWDENRNELVVDAVEELIVRTGNKTIHLKLNNGVSLFVTEDHPLYLINESTWRKAGELRIGDTLKTLDHSSLAFEKALISEVSYESSEETTYNIKVRRYENSFASGVLAHFY